MNENLNNPISSDFDDIEKGERWLAGIATPAPSDRAITSTKAAMQAEFVRLGRRSGGVVRWHAWHGALAAAACIALCVMVGWRLYGNPHSSASMELAKTEMVWSPETETHAIAFVNIDESLSAIEEALPSDATETADGVLLYEVLSDAVGATEASRPAGSSMRSPASGSNQFEDTI